MTRQDKPSADFFDSAYRTKAPWDVGKAQPALVELFEELPPIGAVLDVGCGTGDLTLFLAGRNLSVIGVDLAEGAIREARVRASRTETEIAKRVDFRVGDAFHVAAIPDNLQTVVDSGFFHIFDADEREAFAEELAAKLPTGGRYYLLGFAFQPTFPNAPREVKADELRSLFSAEHGWRVLALRRAQFLTLGGSLPALVACFERTT